MSGQAVNLASDTQTRPTEAMRAAIAAAEVGDEQKFLDPTTNELQERVAELLGHEAALFLPSGTMCNLIAFRLHLRPGGDEVILAANSHPVGFEAGSPAAVNGAMTRQIDTATGIYGGDDVRAALRRPGDRYAPRSRLVSVEQTTNMGSGRVWPLDAIREVLAVAAESELRAHLDGARLMNAVVASGVSAADYASGFDTAWIDFTKGLGAPIGAVLAGSRELIDEAWRYKQMIGGALRQSGIATAGCLHALDHHVERLADDHAHARSLAEGLAGIDGVEVELDAIETNIVMFEVADAPAVVERALEAGVMLTAVAPDRIRAVTHLDVDSGQIDVALERLDAVIAKKASV
jgi:threonine aldolase